MKNYIIKAIYLLLITVLAHSWVIKSNAQIRSNTFLGKINNWGGKDISVKVEEGSENVWVGGYMYLGKYNKETNNLSFLSPINSPLPGYGVTALEVTSAGTVWVATRNGIGRKSDEGWKTFTKENSPLTTNKITAIKSNEEITVIGTNEGLFKKNGEKWEVLKSNNSNLQVNKITSVGIINNNEIWAGQNGTLYYLSRVGDNTPYNEGHINSTGYSPVNEITVGPSDTVWVGYEGKGVIKYIESDKTKKSDKNYYKKGKTDYPDNIYSLEFESDSTLWVGTGQGLGKITPYDDEFPVYGTELGLSTSRVSDASSRNGRVWVANSIGGFYSFQNERFIDIGFHGNEVFEKLSRYDKAISHAGDTTWVSASEGLLRYTDREWEYVEGPDSRTSHIFTALTGQGVWVAYDDGLHNYQNGEWTRYTDEKYPYILDSPIAVNKAGSVWLSSSGGPTEVGGGVVHFDGSEWTKYTSSNSPLPHNLIKAIKTEGTKNIWIGTAGGLAKFSEGEWSVYTSKNSELPDDDVTAIARDSTGVLWIGMYRGLASFDGAEWKTYSASDLGFKDSDAPFVRSLTVTPNGTVWAATPEGIAFRKGGEWGSIRPNGSLFPSVKTDFQQVLASQDGQVWIDHHRAGMFSITPDFSFETSSPIRPGELSVLDKGKPVKLGWKKSPSEDVYRYRVYRSQSPIDSAAGPSSYSAVQKVHSSANSTTDDVFVGGTYYYRLTSVDRFGNESSFSNEVRVTPIDKTPPYPPSIPAIYNEHDPVEVDWFDSAHKFTVYRSTSYFTDSTKAVRIGTTSSNPYNDFSAAIDSSYVYRIAAVDTAGNQSDLSGGAFRPAIRASAEFELSTGSSESSRGYRLVALPGKVEYPFRSAVEGEFGVEWKAYWDNGAVENYLSRASSFRSGRGYWLVKKTSWEVDTSFAAPELNSDFRTLIDLHDGWNIISNPLTADVPWTAVDKANPDTLQSLWGFDGSFHQADTLASATKGTAYYFLNDVGLDSLIIPNSSLQPRRPEKSSSHKGSLITLRAYPQGNQTLSSSVRIGLSNKADKGIDSFDQVAPPGKFSVVNLWIKAPNGVSKRRRFLAEEHRPLTDGGQTFNLVLTSEVTEGVKIETDNLSSLDSFEARLLHPKTGESYNLRKKHDVLLKSPDSTKLHLAIGSEDYVQSKIEDLVPEKLRLTSYPNPVQKQGTIVYTLPEQREVTLRVYDILGREVATLARGMKETGRHRIRLKTDQFASGVYFGRLKAGNQTRIQKITVVH